jgi:uncharacterized membrane protein YgcG
MNAKILLIAFSAAAFASCSTAYKSGQTPDDVYYSPVKLVEERKDEARKREETRPAENTADYNRVRMTFRDRRWRDLDNDYDYSYNNSPYHYCTCNCNNYGYFYNPYYYSKPLYSPRVIPAAAINSTPRTVNLNTYKNYATAVHTDPKSGITTSQTTTRQYNNSNNSGSKVGNILREVFTPSSNNTNSNSTNNNTRTYTPSTNNNSSSGSSNSGSSSGGSSSGGSVSRPGRG